MPLAGALATFRSNVTAFQGFIARAYGKDTGGAYLLSKDERSFIVDAAFLRIFIAWETYLEMAFLSYLCGNGSSAGKLPTRFAMPPSVEHAHALLLGTQKYIDWANPEIVRKLAANCFLNGEPIGTTISAIQNDLFDLKTIRNAAAHMTSTSSRPLDALASRRLNRACMGISVSDLLLALDPNAAGTNTILDGYLSLLDGAAANIAGWS